MTTYGLGYDRLYADEAEIFSLSARRPYRRNKRLADPWANSPTIGPALAVMVVRVDMAVSGAEPEWLRPAIERIASLGELSVNWDGYGAARISERAIERAANYVAAIAERGVAAPTVVPLVRGAVQLEWETPNGDLEIVLAGDGPALVFRENLDVEEQPMDDTRAGDAAATWLLPRHVAQEII